MVLKKQLHVARDLTTLKKKAELDAETLSERNPHKTRLLLPSLIQKADAEFNKGDEESAFLLYMRYANLAVFLRGKDRMENTKSPAYLEKAVSRCEQLSESLKQRYEQARIEADLSKCPGPPESALDEPQVGREIHDCARDRSSPAWPSAIGTAFTKSSGASEPTRTRSDDAARPTPAAVDPPSQKGPSFVKSAELRDLLIKRQVLVLDIRTSEAFKNSHIKLSPDIINVPTVHPGITAHSIAESLPPESKELFNRRQTFQKVVVVDWEGQDPTEPYTKPYCVSEALKKWVPSEESITCEHLKSGYKLWTMTFPHDTTNPMPDAGKNAYGNCDNSAKPSGQTEDLRTLSWLPEMFQREVKVVPSSSVVPIVAPRTGKVADTASESKKPLVTGTELVPETKPDRMPPTAKAPDSADCGETSKDGIRSKNPIEQAARIPHDRKTSHKPGIPPGAASSKIVHRLPRTSLMRSRSMSDIYEESASGDGFSCAQTGNDLEAKKPSFDRALKPTGSLEAATVHQPSTVPKVASTSSDKAHQTNGSGADSDACKRQAQILAPTRIERVKPAVPPKSRRSQSPVQAYIYGTIDRTSGLRNLRNTCYLNSVIQALAHSTDFAQYFVRKEHLSHIRNPKKGNFATLFAHLLAQLWSQTDTREVLTLFREQIGIRCPMYRSSEQQDSHEFLMSLLTVLHEDLNVAETKSRASPDDPDLVVTSEMLHSKLNEFFVAHQERQRSIVTSNFEGILLSGLTCLTCEKDSYTFQVFNVLSVPIPSAWPEVDLQACFDQFFGGETVGEWLCPHCKKKRSATKQIRIARLPKHLVIHLIRFKNEPWISSSTTINKVNNRVYFNEDLDCRDFSRYVYSKNVQLKSYKLYSIVKHHGTLTSGHYISQCRFLGKQAQRWYCYNDQEVTPLRNLLDVDNAYMLFYSCVKNG